MKAWRAPALPGAGRGRLWCRAGGSGDVGVLLLHGLVATGDVFGASGDRLAIDHVVAVPDLLGFGRSIDDRGDDFGTTAHLASIGQSVDQILGARRVLVAAHSMGSALALRWATANAGRTGAVVLVGAPMWAGADEARAALGSTGPLARAFRLDSRLAAGVCRFNCRHRWLAGWVAAALAPRWPVAISRQASLHTWPAYHQALEQQILHADWADMLGALDRAGVPVLLVWGDADPVGDPAYAADVAARLPLVEVEVVPGADHTLPASHPALIPDRLATLAELVPDRFSDRGPGQPGV